MADSKFGVFCNQYLLYETCPRGDSCLFSHARMCDVTLDALPKFDDEFVTGRFEHPLRGGRQDRVRGKGRRFKVYHRPNYTEEKVLYQIDPRDIYKPNANQEALKRMRERELSERANMPSTSSQSSASTSTSNVDTTAPVLPSSTGSKKKTKGKQKASHTRTSGALEVMASEESQKKEEPSQSKEMSWYKRAESSQNKAESSHKKEESFPKNVESPHKKAESSHKMVKFSQRDIESCHSRLIIKSSIINEDWVNAPEFIPKAMMSNLNNLTLDEDKSKKKLCPYAERDGICRYPTGECTYLHGNKCDFCGKGALHPYNEEQSKLHTQECIKQHERDMELSFAIARSKEKVCGICFEVVMQKAAVEQRFGILPNCNHCFCLTCIRRWRQAKQFENKIIRACPECRLTSDFVCPSAYWVDTKDEKDKVIENYKQVLSKKDCKYFKKGNGRCPFGNKCFYMHALNNGEQVDVGPPPSHRTTDVTQEIELIQRLLMLGYLRDNLSDNLEFEDILNIVDLDMTDSDSDMDFFSDCDDYYGTEYW